MSILIVRQSVDLAVIALWVLQPDREHATAIITAGRRILGFMNEVSWEKKERAKAGPIRRRALQLWI